MVLLNIFMIFALFRLALLIKVLLMKKACTTIFHYLEQKAPDVHWRNREKGNDKQYHQKVSFFI